MNGRRRVQRGVLRATCASAADSIVGRRGEGWKVSRSTLKHERNLIGDPRFLRDSFDGVVELARRTQRSGRPAIEDAHVRQRLAEIEGYVLQPGVLDRAAALRDAARCGGHAVMLPTA